MSRKSWVRIGMLLLLALGGFPAALSAGDAREPNLTWYKGNTHAHSLWSDGDALPETVADWYKAHGYQFLVFTDHNVTQQGEAWVNLAGERQAVIAKAIEQCRRRFGEDSVSIRGQDAAAEFRLKTLEEIRPKFDEAGKFLLIQGEEITTKVGGRQVHLNAVNLGHRLVPAVGLGVRDTLRLNILAMRKQAEDLRRSKLVHVNHPSWPKYDISAEDMAAVEETRSFEVCNASPGANQYGDANHPGIEKMWDIASTIRIGRLKAPPLFGVGSDDAHHYRDFSSGRDNPGRAWIVVRAAALTPDSLIEAMNRGDFYASTGVVLKDVRYDANVGTLAVEVQPEAGVNYTIEFIGTLAGTDPNSRPGSAEEARDSRGPGGYSAEVGKVLESVRGTKAAYKFTGKELYVRAAIRSDKPMANPPKGEVSKQEAWTQPVGWEKRLAQSKPEWQRAATCVASAV